MGLEVENRAIVVPGEILATGLDYLPGAWTYRNGDVILAARLGLVQVDGRALKLIPLSGGYNPKRGDTIVGKVEDITLNGWRISLNSPYTGMLSLKDATSEFVARGADLTKFFELDDFVACKIINVTSQKLVDLTMKGSGLKKLGPGRIIMVNTNKVPRIIGKQNSMVRMIRSYTHSNIVVGHNGLIWMHSETPQAELLVIRALRMVEEEAHMSGLTERVEKYLRSEAQRLGLPEKADVPEEEPEQRFQRREFNGGGFNGERREFNGERREFRGERRDFNRGGDRRPPFRGR